MGEPLCFDGVSGPYVFVPFALNSSRTVSLNCFVCLYAPAPFQVRQSTVMPTALAAIGGPYMMPEEVSLDLCALISFTDV